MKTAIESRLASNRRIEAAVCLRKAIDCFILSLVEEDDWQWRYSATGWRGMAGMKPDNYPSTAVDDLKRQFYAAIADVLLRNATPEAYAKRQASAAKDDDDLRAERGAKTADEGAGTC